jgi:hypothetical protein
VPRTTTPQRPAGLPARLASAVKAVLRPTAGEAGRTAPPESTGRQRHRDALAVLTATRGVVGRGWTQHVWYVMDTPAGRRRAAQRFFPGRPDHAHVVEACLVGAVMHAAWQQSPRPEYAYPAVDALWHALFDPAGGDPVGPVCPPLVRAARVRDLTTWNDRDHRTRAEVVQLLDRAAARLSSPRPHAGPGWIGVPGMSG